jgi:hypothetical protein
MLRVPVVAPPPVAIMQQISDYFQVSERVLS